MMGMGWVDMKMGRLVLLAAIYAGLLAAAIGCSAFASANGNGQEWDIILPVDTIHYGGPVTVLIVGPSGGRGMALGLRPGRDRSGAGPSR